MSRYLGFISKHDILQTVIEATPLLQSLDLSNCHIIRDIYNNSTIHLNGAAYLKYLSLNISSLRIETFTSVFIKVELARSKTGLYNIIRRQIEWDSN